MRNSRTLQDTAALPPTYRQHRTFDFKRDKKFSAAVQGLVVLIAALAIGVALLLPLPLRTDWNPILTISVTVAACLGYMAAHEATHGVFLHLLTKVRPSYAVRFPFLTTGSTAFLTRRSAVVVALAPAVIWGILLSAALLTLPQDYLLTAYILFALNFAGSAGDFVEVSVVARQQPDALIQDDGGTIRVFVPQD